MRVAALETIADPKHPHLLWVRVEADSGETGLGETAGEAVAVAPLVHSMLAPLVIGADPRRIELIWQRCFRAINFRGSGGAELRALSALDIALWDLLGRLTGEPVHTLLGGACRDRVPVYNTCGNYGAIRDLDRSLEEPASLARDLLSQGITSMKIWPFDRSAEETGGQRISPQALAAGLEPVAAIRDAVGAEMDIAIEGHGQWNLPAAARIAHALEPLRPIWLEDMIWPDNPRVLGELRSRTTIPVIASERTMTRFGTAQLLDSGACDVVMTDLAWTGGLTEGRRIATVASTRLLPVAPHNCAGPVTHLATLHFCAHIPNLMLMETIRAFYFGYFPEIVGCVPVPNEHGCLPVPDGPGLGAELTASFLERPELLRKRTTSLVGESEYRSDPWLTMKF